MSDKPSEVVFGVFDGLTSVLGLIVPLAASGNTVLLRAAFGLAAASTVGMGFGEYLGDPDVDIKQAALMAGATALGTLLPIVPFFFAHGAGAIVLSFTIALLLCAAMAAYRSRYESTARAWVETYSIFGVATVVSLAVAISTGAA